VVPLFGVPPIEIVSNIIGEAPRSRMGLPRSSADSLATE
jgi:hypothetical protein